MKVGIIGPESTGKSTLAKYLANRYKGTLIPEYARDYMENLDRPYTYEDVVAIAKHQVEELSNLNDELYFFDTELIVTKVWFLHKYGSCPDWLQQAILDYPMDVYLLTYPDLPWVPDPVRENPDIRLELFQRYEHEIQSLNIPYYIIKHIERTPRTPRAHPARTPRTHPHTLSSRSEPLNIPTHYRNDATNKGLLKGD